eukprot:c5197_g1_i3.p1 GENE.c5197_g1_i3~~c5197_g1_i3.p1  ORF type:complete len:269 (+),score=56.83 c5197_g1_i3:41-847(+)
MGNTSSGKKKRESQTVRHDTHADQHEGHHQPHSELLPGQDPSRSRIGMEKELTELKEKVLDLQQRLDDSENRRIAAEQELEALKKSIANKPAASAPQASPQRASIRYQDTEVARLKELLEVADQNIQAEREKAKLEIAKERKLREQTEQSLAEYIKGSQNDVLSTEATLKAKIEALTESEKKLREQIRTHNRQSASTVDRKQVQIAKLEQEKAELVTAKEQAQQQATALAAQLKEAKAHHEQLEKEKNKLELKLKIFSHKEQAVGGAE